ncbi:MAG: hypothetical protein GKR89_11175 [Candidatus Latescibacteria bacterium]|nr:hypothetical protein [Candidatus Latescibacterota bacterium]
MNKYPILSPDNREEILAFFEQNKYAVVSDALSRDDMAVLNAFVDRSKGEIPREWGPDKLGVYSHGQILVHHPELDRFVQPEVSFDLVQAIMGPQTRFAQFDFRDVPAGKGDGQMHFHRDRPYLPTTQTEPERPYECTYVCAIHYLSDVEAEDPCFCVVPNSGPYEKLEEAKAQLGPAYQEVPIRGPAGTLVLYDIAIFHTRLPGQRARARRTLHHYYSRQASGPLTNWVLVPKRLAQHPDPGQRSFYSQWSEATQAYAESGFAEAFYQEHVLDKLT